MTIPKWLSKPNLRTRDEVLAKPCPVPAEPGVYAWFFKEIPAEVPTGGCLIHDGCTLLYIGISPKAPPRNGRKPSKSQLRQRLRTHQGGNAEGSTLRRTLGCLLAPVTGYPLSRVGSGKRMTFTHLGEQALDRWMGENALVTWQVRDKPWLEEERLIGKVSLPLNLAGNDSHPFSQKLREIRSTAIRAAKDSPIADETGTSRSG